MRTTIQNRDSVDLAVEIDLVEQSRGVAFVAHGLGGFIEQPHIGAFSEGFLRANYSVIRWDAANTIGASGGRMEDATVTSYYRDLEDVILWARSQSWHQEPFVLCGHSLGGMISILYAESYPDRVRGLAPISATISGELTRTVYWSSQELAEWQSTGIRIEVSVSKPGVLKRTTWSFVEDLLRYDTRQMANRLTMPTLMIVGEKDTGIPVAHQKLLLDRIPAESKRLVIIDGAPHDFREEHELAQLRNVIAEWAATLNDATGSASTGSTTRFLTI